MEPAIPVAVAGDAQEIELTTRSAAGRSSRIFAPPTVEADEGSSGAGLNRSVDRVLDIVTNAAGLREAGFAIKLKIEGSTTEAPP